ncbi:MAG TPA: Gfo/Idh/MocA family oxidoreductase [Kofleriaceae bacterium]|nr:Gfo/Idh/MocA family oxidoreductase [Kofleriaceae bacterium]
MNRREFVTRSSAALAALGLARCSSPNRRIGLGVIGVGGFGGSAYHLGYYVASPRVDVIAVADPEAAHVDAAIAYAHGRPAGYRDYRELLARDDIHAVVIVTPDHWHAKLAIEAAAAGKHVYCEKPLTLTVAEGRAIVDAALRAGIVFQTGSEQRSGEEFHLACEIVRNGRIGTLVRIEASSYGTPIMPAEPANPQPATLDWDLWLGPAPAVPYHQLRAAGTFRYFRDYSGGTITDLGAHELDIAQWGAGTERTGPTQVRGTGVFPADSFYETATEFDIEYTYASGLVLRFFSSAGPWPVRFVGTDGEVSVDNGSITASRPEILDYELGSGDVVLPRSRDHIGNWLDAIEHGTPTIADAEIGHRSATLCHLGNIAIDTGRTLTWDPATEQFVGDADANARLSRPYRAGWEL